VGLCVGDAVSAGVAVRVVVGVAVDGAAHASVASAPAETRRTQKVPARAARGLKTSRASGASRSASSRADRPITIWVPRTRSVGRGAPASGASTPSLPTATAPETSSTLWPGPVMRTTPLGATRSAQNVNAPSPSTSVPCGPTATAPYAPGGSGPIVPPTLTRTRVLPHVTGASGQGAS
jgi:hypothetical protein